MSTQTKRVTIQAPPERVWAVLSDFGSVANWAPTVLRSKSLTDPGKGAGARRVLHHRSGRAVEEAVREWSNERRSFTFDVPGGIGPIKTVREAWSVRAESGGSVVEVTLDLTMKYGPIGPALDALFGRRLMGRELALSLAGLKQYAETGRAEKVEARLPVAAVH